MQAVIAQMQAEAAVAAAAVAAAQQAAADAQAQAARFIRSVLTSPSARKTRRFERKVVDSADETILSPETFAFFEWLVYSTTRGSNLLGNDDSAFWKARVAYYHLHWKKIPHQIVTVVKQASERYKEHQKGVVLLKGTTPGLGPSGVL
eukprot:2422052-Rhodomonas_salina.1